MAAAMNLRVTLAQAMILAAGKGTRLGPVTEKVPKCLIAVGGKPILFHTLERLREYGITDLVISVRHLARTIVDSIGDGSSFGLTITYSQEDAPLGTAGGVRRAASLFGDGPLLVWYGDNLSTCRLDRLWKFHLAKRARATIALFYREDVRESGIAELDSGDQVIRFVEKPPAGQVFSNWVNAGILIVERPVIDALPQVGDWGRNVLPELAAARQLYGYRMSPAEDLWWVDTPADLARVQNEWRRRSGL
jgi:NDP-sugar pyrophosphorylase family protein